MWVDPPLPTTAPLKENFGLKIGAHRPEIRQGLGGGGPFHHQSGFSVSRTALPIPSGMVGGISRVGVRVWAAEPASPGGWGAPEASLARMSLGLLGADGCFGRVEGLGGPPWEGGLRGLSVSNKVCVGVGVGISALGEAAVWREWDKAAEGKLSKLL